MIANLTPLKVQLPRNSVAAWPTIESKRYYALFAPRALALKYLNPREVSQKVAAVLQELVEAGYETVVIKASPLVTECALEAVRSIPCRLYTVDADGSLELLMEDFEGERQLEELLDSD